MMKPKLYPRGKLDRMPYFRRFLIFKKQQHRHSVANVRTVSAKTTGVCDGVTLVNEAGGKK